MKKRIVAMILVLSVIIGQHEWVSFSEAKQEPLSIVPKEVVSIAIDYYQRLNEICNTSLFDGKGIHYKDTKIGNPFIIYEQDMDSQDEIYYFPLIRDNRVIALLCVVGTVDGWSIALSEEWNDSLNKLSCDDIPEIIIKTHEKLQIADKRDSDTVDYRIKNYMHKIRLGQHVLKRIDTDKISISTKNIKDEYSPKFSISTKNAKQCKLYNNKSQGDRGICWAASVATIINYLMGKNVSAPAVCNEMGIQEGATLWEASNALDRFGADYQDFRFQVALRMELNEIKASINRKRPIYVSSKSDKHGHAVVAFGYSEAGGHVYINFWNPQGKGSVVSSEYRSKGTVIVCGNESYVWKYSIS